MNRERRDRDLTRTLLTLIASWPNEKSHDAAWRTRLISIKQMENIRVIEIYGLRDKAKAKKANVEIEIALCVGGDRAYVVDAK